MLHNMEDIQIFAMAIPGGNHKFYEITIIDPGMSNIMDTGICTKAIDKWNKAELYTWP